jgi:hypothetical protein
MRARLWSRISQRYAFLDWESASKGWRLAFRLWPPMLHFIHARHFRQRLRLNTLASASILAALPRRPKDLQPVRQALGRSWGRPRFKGSLELRPSLQQMSQRCSASS